VFWQSYPSAPFAERLDWVADVFCNFRGLGWDWQTSGVPPPPDWAKAQLEGDLTAEEKAQAPTVSKTGIRRYSDRTQLVRHSLQLLAVGYVVLDLAATLMHKDPYYWGYTESKAPSYLPSIIQNSSVLTQSYRLLLSLSGIYFALWTIFRLGPAFFCGILSPKWVGLRAEAWMNPADHFGSFSMVLDKGLAGWWGGWWHQTFRFAFEAPATALLGKMNINKRSAPGKPFRCSWLSCLAA